MLRDAARLCHTNEDEGGTSESSLGETEPKLRSAEPSTMSCTRRGSATSGVAMTSGLPLGQVHLGSQTELLSQVCFPAKTGSAFLRPEGGLPRPPQGVAPRALNPRATLATPLTAIIWPQVLPHSYTNTESDMPLGKLTQTDRLPWQTELTLGICGHRHRCSFVCVCPTLPPIRSRRPTHGSSLSRSVFTTALVRYARLGADT